LENSFSTTQHLNRYIDISTTMATFTISSPKELERLRKKHPEIDWNEVMKQGILRRLKELQKFEELKKKGAL